MLRPYIAVLLLLCLGRTLLPEAWLLAWHPHAHTTHEPAYRLKGKAGKLLLTTRHQHCHAEQFYDVPFAPGNLVLAPRPRVRARYLAFAAPRLACWFWPAPLHARLRGPPARG